MRKFCHASESIADSPPGKIIFYKPVRNFNTRHYISATKVNSDFTLVFDFGIKEETHFEFVCQQDLRSNCGVALLRGVVKTS